MSQYPTPYQPPQPPGFSFGWAGFAPPETRFARNAGLLMILLGVLLAFFAGCFIAAGFVLNAPPESMSPEQREQLREMQEQLQRDTGAEASSVMKVAGGVMAVPAFLVVLLGIFVRRGHGWAIIFGFVLTAAMAALLGIAVVLSLIAMTQDPRVAANVCLMAVPLALLVLQAVWLWRAIMNLGSLKLFNAQQQAWQWQMAQQAAAQRMYYQQMYPQQGYPYPSAPPPPGGPQQPYTGQQPPPPPPPQA